MHLISSHVRSVLVKFKAPARALSSHNLLQEARDNHINYDSHRVVRLFPFFPSLQVSISFHFFNRTLSDKRHEML